MTEHDDAAMGEAGGRGVKERHAGAMAEATRRTRERLERQLDPSPLERANLGAVELERLERELGRRLAEVSERARRGELMPSEVVTEARRVAEEVTRAAIEEAAARDRMQAAFAKLGISATVRTEAPPAKRSLEAVASVYGLEALEPHEREELERSREAARRAETAAPRVEPIELWNLVRFLPLEGGGYVLAPTSAQIRYVSGQQAAIGGDAMAEVARLRSVADELERNVRELVEVTHGR